MIIKTLKYIYVLFFRNSETIENYKEPPARIISGSKIDVPFGDVLLDAGNHTLRVTMTNDFNIPLLGDRNLYVGSVKLI
jgi:hypothetical protein